MNLNRLAPVTLLTILPAFAQQQPKFDLADVHSSATPLWFAQNNGGILRDGLYINRDATMMQLIQLAYGVNEDAISGGPNWLKSDLFDVIAKVPEATTRETASLMLQSLLADRFGLAIKKEMRPTPRYVLTVAKGGSKLKPAAEAKDSGCRPKQSAANFQITCHNMTTAQLAVTLRQVAGSQYNTYLDHEVLDSTKLDGKYDFDLEFTPSLQVADKGDQAITLFDAVTKQLGLKLDLQNVPLPLWVIDKVNRKPTPNPPAVVTGLVLAAPRFEVAAVKPADPAQPRMPNGAMLRYTGGSQMQAAGTLRNLLSQAFQIQPNAANDVFIGLPKSADTQVWNITAKLPATGEGAPLSINGRTQPPSINIVREMLKGLLADQFELKSHTENREVTVYALTQNGKHKLIKADPNERSDCRPDASGPKPVPSISVMVICKNTTMAEFARNLEQATGFFDHPVADATGLEGGWNFMIGWSSQQRPAVPNPNQPPGAATTSDPGFISAPEAVELETGLKVVKQKRSIPVIVIDHIAEMPVE